MSSETGCRLAAAGGPSDWLAVSLAWLLPLLVVPLFLILALGAGCWSIVRPAEFAVASLPDATATSGCKLRISLAVERKLMASPSLEASDTDSGDAWSSDPTTAERAERQIRLRH